MRSPRRGPRSRAARWLPVAGVVLAAIAGPARAQSGGEVRLNEQGSGLAWGPATIRPTVIFNYGYDSNIFYASDDLTGSEPLGSRQGQFQPGFKFDIPFGESYLRGGYSALYRNYATEEYQPTTQWSHYFDLDGRIRAGSRAWFNLRDRFVRGTEELREVDPGGELAFGDLPFRTHTPSVEAGMDLGARQGVSVVWNYSSSQFTDIDDLDFLSYRGHGLQARYNHRTGPDAGFYIYYGADTMRQTRGEDLIEYSGYGTGVGYNKMLGRNVTTSIVAGYQVLDASGLVDSAYHGPTVTGSASWLLGDATRFTFSARRQPFQSFYLNNAYYLNRGLSLEVLRQVGVASYWRVMFGLDQNAYSDPLDVTGEEAAYCRDDGNGLVCPSAGVRRRDHGWRGELGYGAQLSRMARWYIGYNWQDRTSNLLQQDADGFGDPFSYEVNHYFFRIEVGWL